MNTRRKIKNRLHKTRRKHLSKIEQEKEVLPKEEEEEVLSKEEEEEVLPKEEEEEVLPKEEEEEVLPKEEEEEEILPLEKDHEIINKIFQEEIPNIPMTKEWRIDLSQKANRIPVMVYLELHGIGKKALKKYMIDHILDTLPHDERLALAKHVKSPTFIPTKPLERRILEYFDFLTIKDGERAFIVLGKTCYNLNNNWSIMIVDDRDEMYRSRFFVDTDNLSDIFGYIENETFKINERACSTKTEMIKTMNEILKLSGSNYWYDTATTREKPRRNSDNLSNAAFCAVTELYLRKLNDERSNKKIWFLKPEQNHFIF
jgi:hypothetical protein